MNTESLPLFAKLLLRNQSMTFLALPDEAPAPRSASIGRGAKTFFAAPVDFSLKVPLTSAVAGTFSEGETRCDDGADAGGGGALTGSVIER